MTDLADTVADPLILARVQFAFTVAFHILFPAFTIGLASFLVTLESLWLITRRPVFRDLYDFWLKPFAISFGMGVVSGVVMSYQIGTNWSGFALAGGSVLGPLFGYEVLGAFFLEASFLGIMLFGRGRVSDWVHLLATALVALGTLVSAFFILAANSWMHTPAGFGVEDGRFVPADWMEIIFNPSTPYRVTHMVIACYLGTAMIVAGVAAWHLLKGTHRTAARVLMLMALPFIAVAASAQVAVGHASGEMVHRHQPVKLAAIEGHWDSYDRGAPLVLFALPSREAADNLLELKIPVLGSLIVTGSPDGALAGLKAWAPSEWPPVAPVFWAFRLMVGLGVLMLAVGWIGTWHLWHGRLWRPPGSAPGEPKQPRRFLKLCVLAAPSGLLAVLAGWMTTEIGRQPYVIYGHVRTADALSPVAGEAVGMSLMVFVFAYTVIFGAGLYYILALFRKGPEPREAERGAPPVATQVAPWAGVRGHHEEDRPATGRE